MASEEMSFENVDDRRRRTDGRTTDACLYYKLTITKWIKSYMLPCFGTFKMLLLMFISRHVFRPEGQGWNPVRRDTMTYVRRILNASRISKNQLISSTISQS